MRCAIYARYSSENQRDASIEDQIRICQARADREGWAVVACLSDAAVSGATLLRPGYQALLAMVRAGSVDVVLAESLDRFSRDQEHVASFYKQSEFATVRIWTLSEGEISQLHVGLKGTMGALYLKDLADKTRRGLEGRVRQGRSGGGICYGYRVARGPVGRDGELERGLREIDPAEAVIVRRIFAEFAAGAGPKSIAATLNRDGVPGPRGGIWQAGTIRGQAGRDTGLLRNRLYAGELVWNQRRWVKDPGTGRRLARQNASQSVINQEVPELRIVEADLWDKVQVRLASQRAEVEQVEDGAPRRRFWEQRRPQHLLSGKVVCGQCRKTFASVGRDYLACRVAQADGPCDNRTRVRRGALEAQVLDALGGDLMQPEMVAAFVADFTAEWNRLSAEAGAGITIKRRELDGIKRKLSGLVDAIADGLRAPGLQGRLDELEQRRVALEAEIAASAAPVVPRLHPNLAEVYREEVARLREGLAQEDAGPEVREALRALIERVEVHPPAAVDGEPRIELIGHLASMLRAARNAKNPSAFGAEGLVLECSAKVDAGTGFEPVTFRL